MNIEKLKQIIKGDVAADAATLKRDSHDASLFEVIPKVVVYPKDSIDIKNLVKFVNEQKLSGEQVSLTARSGGTDMSGGPLSSSIVIEFTKYFNKNLIIGDGFAIAEPGIFYHDFEKETLKKGLLLPTYPASREICTVGGMVANNSGGEKTLAYGKTENYIESLKMVLADGNEYEIKPLNLKELERKEKENSFEGGLYKQMHNMVENNYDILQKAKPHVSKNSAGYYLWNILDKEKGVFDLTKLIAGSQGTLGLITEIKFKLIQPKPYSKLIVIFLKDLEPLTDIVETVLPFKPESFESFDDNTLKIALRFLPDVLKILKGNAVSLAFQFLPEFWMALTGGIPKLIMLAEFTGDNKDVVNQTAENVKKVLSKFKIKTRIIESDREAKKYWTLRRESFNLLRHHLSGLRTAPFIDDIVVSVEKLSSFLPELNKILAKYKLIETIAGHVGDANFHIIPLMDLSDPKSKEIIKNLSSEVYELVFKYRGSITAEHNDGLIRSPYLKEMYGDKIYKLFEETKKIFDPNNIFNPGKKVGASLEFSLNHINTAK